MSENFSANSTLAHYRILSKLGAGGMGEVYLAQDTKLDRRVVLKILPEEFAFDVDRMRRFVLEAKSASALNHPNIITIYEIGQTNGTNFIATEYIDGRTLNNCDSMSLTAALEVAIQIASALQAAHSAGIVHRDIKPDNVMLRPDGLVKILDFGIAKLSGAPLVSGRGSDSEAATAVKSGTSTGMIVGTACYMSPEQARGKAIDSRSDLFSFGVLFYEMLSGHKPFSGDNPMDVIGSIIADEPTPINKVLTNLPPEVDRIVSKALCKNRDERYQTAVELLVDLKNLQKRLEFEEQLGETSLDRKIFAQMPEAATAVFSSSPGDGRSTGIDLALQKNTSRLNADTTVLSNSWWSSRGLIIAVALLLLSAAIAGVYFFKDGPTGQIDSIAVLAFENRSGDANSEYLSDGLAESLIYRLSQLPNLRVSPTSSVFRYKGKELDPIKIGRELGVNAVMSGRIVQRGESLTISVELVDVRNNKLLWGEQYERKMSELLATQREIATEITNKLQLRLSSEDSTGLSKRYTNNDEAYQLYLKGRYHFAKRTKDDILKSVEYFQQAIKLDPNYALAYAGLADCYNGMTAYPYLSPKEAVPQAKAAAKKALEIDPSLAEAHTALANSLACFDWNWEEAERAFKRAIELNPNDSGTHWRYGMFYLMVLGRADESIAEGKRAVELEPLNLNNSANLSGLYFHARQNEKAYAEARQVFDLDPNFIVGRWALSQASIMKEMYAEAIALNEESLRKDPTNQVFLRFAGLGYAKAGRREEADRIIGRYREIAKTQYVMSYHIAVIYAALGEKDKAFAELEKAFEEHDYLLPRIKVEPFLDPLRDDPRYKQILQRLKLPH